MTGRSKVKKRQDALSAHSTTSVTAGPQTRQLTGGYGLSDGVWSSNQARALSIARRLRTGQVILNGAAPNMATPFGGCKQSRMGRENRRFGVEEFFHLKAIQGAVS